uniref:Uncharacterized protein n=1 Tax=Strombidium rassoulzadegani TaxID=1082188 RepID=A0A7S3FYC1_9SPIT|mmetsp:Transcript_1946/g.3371  ORF Transcript_1946/g.3371 Transcript_1946/m.3371 type:complete len:231 (+) Transcript_1946:1642-2334(+)
MSEQQLMVNIAKMTVMWSASSFSSYLLSFMNKYLEGSIYTNNYAEAVAGGLACVIGAKIYSRVGMRASFIISFSLGLAGGLMIYLLESEMVQVPSSVLEMFEGTLKQQRVKALDYLVPKLIFFSKFGITFAFISTYQASFSNDNIFPPEKRATSIGHCQLIGRGFTILAPEVTELPKPLPIACFCGMALLAMVVSFTFDAQSEPNASPAPPAPREYKLGEKGQLRHKKEE